MTSLVRAKKFAQKRASRFAVFHIVEGQDTDAGQIPGATDGNYHLGNLAGPVVILGSGTYVHSASDAATSFDATIGTASGGTQIAGAMDLTSTGNKANFTGRSWHMTGCEIWLNIASTGAGTDVGEYYFYVEYLELEKTTGEYNPMTEA